MMEEKMTGYSLMREWFNFCFENPELISPTHVAMYCFIVEHCNRLGWKKKFGLPTEMTKEAIGIKNYKTFSKTLNDLISWGFIELLQQSKNQYSSNIIALVKNTKAHGKALTKASLKHIPKQVQSTVGIYKPNNNKHITNKQEKFEIGDSGGCEASPKQPLPLSPPPPPVPVAPPPPKPPKRLEEFTKIFGAYPGAKGASYSVLLEKFRVSCKKHGLTVEEGLVVLEKNIASYKAWYQGELQKQLSDPKYFVKRHKDGTTFINQGTWKDSSWEEETTTANVEKVVW